MANTITRPQFDERMREYIFHSGWHINDDGLLELTAKQASKADLERSIRNPAKHILMIPCLHGCALLFEGQHFIIVN